MADGFLHRFPWWGLVLVAAALALILYFSADVRDPVVAATQGVVLLLVMFGFRWLVLKNEELREKRH